MYWLALESLSDRLVSLCSLTDEVYKLFLLLIVTTSLFEGFFGDFRHSCCARACIEEISQISYWRGCSLGCFRLMWVAFVVKCRRFIFRSNRKANIVHVEVELLTFDLLWPEWIAHYRLELIICAAYEIWRTVCTLWVITQGRILIAQTQLLLIWKTSIHLQLQCGSRTLHSIDTLNIVVTFSVILILVGEYFWKFFVHDCVVGHLLIDRAS